jgi:acyl-CoA thioesterase I
VSCLVPCGRAVSCQWAAGALAALLALGGACTETAQQALTVEASSTRSHEPGMPSAPLAREDQPKVAFLGDSIAAGQFLAEHQAFPSVLQRQLSGRGAGFVLVNASVNGDTTEDGLRRVDWLLKQRPRVVVIELGENDKREALPVAATEANLRAIIAKVKAADVKPLLLGLNVTPERSAERASALAYARELAAVYPRIAADLDVAFVPEFMGGVAGRREFTLSDGIHPTPEGHERVAHNIADPLRALLDE